MRAWLWGTIFGASSLIVAACGDTEGGDGTQTAGQPTGGSSSGQAGSASAGKAGEPASGGGAGSGTGGASTAGVSSGGEAGSASGGTAGAVTGGSGGLLDCDPRKILCKRVAPECGDLEVPSVEGSCYGECVKIDRCACDGPDACPDNSQYTCLNSAKHCSPFLK